jgi:hypothetical protein
MARSASSESHRSENSTRRKPSMLVLRFAFLLLLHRALHIRTFRKVRKNPSQHMKAKVLNN